MGATSSRDLMRLQLDEVLSRWRAASLSKAPPTGWVRAIRGALGMSGRALGERARVSISVVRKLEASEANGTISLASLRKLAEALDCELQYALVPRKPLQEMLLDRARQVAEAEFRPVAHSMALEDQRVNDSSRNAHIDAYARFLVARGSLRNLW